MQCSKSFSWWLVLELWYYRSFPSLIISQPTNLQAWLATSVPGWCGQGRSKSLKRERFWEDLRSVCDGLELPDLSSISCYIFQWLQEIPFSKAFAGWLRRVKLWSHSCFPCASRCIWGKETQQQKDGKKPSWETTQWVSHAVSHAGWNVQAKTETVMFEMSRYSSTAEPAQATPTYIPPSTPTGSQLSNVDSG